MTLEPINVLLLGPAGVGKSCFLNALDNYLCYDTIEEAVRGALRVPIATKFTVSNKTTLRHEDVQIGDNSSGNESFGDRGESSTQHSKSYFFEFNIGNVQKAIHIIDTPGVGDTRGIEADKENFRGIMSRVSSVSTLHGIIIMLKPNEARLHGMLEYCITELLAHLHKNTSRNVVFCLTSTLQTDYSVGETIKPLAELLEKIRRKSGVVIPLNESTMYCFENETFRFLASTAARPALNANKRPPTESWEISIREMFRLLSHLNSLEPHTTAETISIERVKTILETLEEPLGFLASNIEDNIKRVEKQKKTIEECASSIEELAKNLKFTRKVITVRDLGYFKNVCSNSCCVDYVDTVDGRKILYKTICHDRCSKVEWQDAESQFRSRCPWLGFQKWACSVINLFGDCKRCGCHFSYHVFINYDKEVSEVEEENPEIAKKIAEGQNAAKVTEALLEDAETRVKELEMERRTVDEVSIRFAVFLHLNSMTSANDYLVKYWRSQIKVRRDLGDDKDNDEILRMEDLLEKHQQAIVKNTERLKIGCDSDEMTVGQMNLSSIMADVERLYDLPLSGHAFRQAQSVFEESIAKYEAKNNETGNRLSLLKQKMTRLCSDSLT